MVFQPAPTFVLPISVDPVTKEVRFSEVWLNWFLSFNQIVNDSGLVDNSISFTEQNIMAVRAFEEHQQYNRTFSLNAQDIIANRVFGP